MPLRLQVRELRLRAGMSRAALARKVGVTPGAIGHWEAGIRIPNPALLYKLAEVLGASLEELKAPDDDEPPKHSVA
jgi:transcriptional regulator with XRE-family HTH domain